MSGEPSIAEFYAERKREQRRLQRKIGRLLVEHAES